MGRLLFMLVVLFMLTFICVSISRLLKRNGIAHKDKRKSFDEDIEAVANKIKERG